MGSGTDGMVGMGNDVHVLYGLSKDLGVAGWRVSWSAGLCLAVRLRFLQDHRAVGDLRRFIGSRVLWFCPRAASSAVHF